MDTYRLSVKDKGRVVLPVALQRACGFAPGAELVARPIGKGTFVVESTDAVLERIWSRLPEGASGDAVGALEDWRAASGEVRRAALESPALAPEEESEGRAAQLLAELGL